MFSPPLYRVYKFEFLDVLKNDFKMSGDLGMYEVNQQDNMLFRQIRMITNDYSKFNSYCIYMSCRGYNSHIEEFKNLIMNGFSVHGRHFQISERSASMTRQQIISFVDSSVYDRLNESIGMGVDIKKTVLSKYIAYRGLMFSSCHCIENWIPKIIIVPDRFTIIDNQNIKYVVDEITKYTDNKTGEEKQFKQKAIKQGVKDIEINMFDGCGIHHPLISKQVKEFLNCKTDITSIQWRVPFTKGVTHEIDYTGFFKDNGVSKIKDIWGIEHSVDDVMIIMTESMYKGYKYFKNFGDYRDWEDYWVRFKKYNHCVGIAKWNFTKEEEPVYTRANYQILQDLNLDFDKFMSLTDYSVNWVHNIVDDNVFYTYCFLGLFYNMHNPMNEYIYAILKNPEMIKEKSVREYVVSLLKKYIDEMKCGKIWIKSCFKILSPDLIALLQHIGGLEVNGCLESDEFYTNDRYGDYNGEFLIERNPHICKSEHTILTATTNDVIKKYVSHLSNVAMINCKSLTPQRLNGADMDRRLSLFYGNIELKTW